MGKIYSAYDWKDYTEEEKAIFGKKEKIRNEIRSLQGKNGKKSKKKRKRLQEELKNPSKKAKTKKRNENVGLSKKETHDKELQMDEWKKRRIPILIRDGKKCVICGSTENLNVHHIYYENGKHLWEYPNSALITLCEKCHQLVHGKNNFHNELNPKSKQNPHNQKTIKIS